MPNALRRMITVRRDAILNGARSDGGFSFVEFLIVLLIVGILAAIAVPVYLSTLERTHNQAAEAAVADAKAAVEDYFVASGAYPSEDDGGLEAADFVLPEVSGELKVEYASTGTAESPDYCITGQWGTGPVYGATKNGPAIELVNGAVGSCADAAGGTTPPSPGAT